MHQTLGRYETTLESGKTIINKLKQSGDYQIYVDDIPYLYMKDKSIKTQIIPGSPYRKKIKNAIVLTKIETEMSHLINADYVCGKVSDLEYIYTNDKTAAAVIKECGINLTDYYPEKRTIDLKELAAINDLSIVDNNAILIEGKAKSLIHGPGIIIYGGRLKVDYDLDLITTDIIDGDLATLIISSNNGRNVMNKIGLSKTYFDENGHCMVSIINDTLDIEDVEFLLLANGNTKIRLNQLVYEKIKED